MGKEYVCACCGEKFISDWSEEEAVEEFNELFAKESIEDAAVVCDTCYLAMRSFYNIN